MSSPIISTSSNPTTNIPIPLRHPHSIIPNHVYTYMGIPTTTSTTTSSNSTSNTNATTTTTTTTTPPINSYITISGSNPYHPSSLLLSSRFNHSAPLQSNHSYQQQQQQQPSPPRFRSKIVCQLNCKYCGTLVCYRAMKAVLLADAGIELFSTDCPPNTVSLFGDDYTTEKCQCRIRDVACITCGNQVGYHVTQPCQSCLDACNNGHMHMYHSEHIKCSERLDNISGRPLLWAKVPSPDRDISSTTCLKIEETCR